RIVIADPRGGRRARRQRQHEARAHQHAGRDQQRAIVGLQAARRGGDHGAAFREGAVFSSIRAATTFLKARPRASKSVNWSNEAHAGENRITASFSARASANAARAARSNSPLICAGVRASLSRLSKAGAASPIRYAFAMRGKKRRNEAMPPSLAM